MERDRLGVPLHRHLQTPAAARAVARKFLLTCGIDGALEDDVALVVSELVTNALIHGAHPVALGIAVRRHVVRIEVTDASPDTPGAAEAPPDDALRGRGLGIVEAIAERWGSVRHPDDGKTVWADLVTPDHRVVGRGRSR